MSKSIREVSLSKGEGKNQASKRYADDGIGFNAPSRRETKIECPIQITVPPS